MKNSDWLDSRSACALLGVKAQTLYAYVSRHKIHVKADPNDSRHSLYARHDIEELLNSLRRPRARADIAEAAIRWGDPVLETSVSEVRDGTIWLRGSSIQDCAEHMTLERVAALLCAVPEVTCPIIRTGVSGNSSFSRSMKVLTAELECSTPLQNGEAYNVAQEAGHMIALIAEACVGSNKDGPVHMRIGSAWRAGRDAEEAIRRSLVLLSDHELNPSTFAVRVCASTGASLPAALLAGMATLSGPRHGGVAGMARTALIASRDGRVEEFFREYVDHAPYTYGFGHPLYPRGDPRARDLLCHIPRRAPARMAVETLAKRLSLSPNIDAALAAMSVHFDWPVDAATTLFSVGRTAGWVAHAVEQKSSGEVIRPRAKYQPGSLTS